MASTYSECTVYILTKDGRKSCNIFRFENQGMGLIQYDTADFQKAFCNVTSGKMFLDQLDRLYEGFLWQNHESGLDWGYNRWWKEESKAIERICALENFEDIEKIIIKENIGLDYGDFGGANYTIDFSTNDTASLLLNRMEELTTKEWRTVFKIGFGGNIDILDDHSEGFEKFAFISGYKGNSMEVIVPRYFSRYKVVGLAVNFLKNADTVKSVIVPEGYCWIESRCFNNCPNLETIVLPSTLVDLEREAIYKCPKAKFIVPEGSNAEELVKERNLPYDVTAPQYNYIEKMNDFLAAHKL